MKKNLICLGLLIFNVFFVGNIWAQETIDFEGIPNNSTVDQVFGDGGSGPINVFGVNPNVPGQNAAVIFDSANPTGGDFDLGTPNQQCPGGGPGNGTDPAVGLLGAFENCDPLGNVLIIQNRGCLEGTQTDCPDDLDFSQIDGATITLDFSELGSVTAENMTFLDVDGNGPNPRVELFDESANLLGSFPIPNQMPDNGAAVVDLGSTSNVTLMVVHLNGSGAIDEIVFIPEELPEIELLKEVSVDGGVTFFDANDGASAPATAVGGGALYRLTVTNTGTSDLVNVVINDAELGIVDFLVGDLAAGQTVVLTSGEIPELEQPGRCQDPGDVTNIATVDGQSVDTGNRVSDSDPAVVRCIAGGEGCTPGYWKQDQHFDSWTAPYTPDTLFSDVFEDAFPGKTMLEVLRQGGGDLIALGRHSVAALLNAASPDVSYDLTVQEVIDMFNAVFPGGDYEDLKDDFEDFNEQGCPLNNGGEGKDENGRGREGKGR